MLELFDRKMRNSADEGHVDFNTFQRAIQQWVEAVKRQSRYMSYLLVMDCVMMYLTVFHQLRTRTAVCQYHR